MLSQAIQPCPIPQTEHRHMGRRLRSWYLQSWRKLIQCSHLLVRDAMRSAQACTDMGTPQGWNLEGYVRHDNCTDARVEGGFLC